MDRRESALQREIGQTRPFQSEAEEATISLLRTTDVVRQRLSSVVEPHGITLQQYNVLRILRGAHPRSLATLEIRDRLIERTPGITRLLDTLEAKGLVRRERSREDRRFVHCWITDAGLELLKGMDAQVDQADEAAVAGLEPEEIRVLLRLLEKVRYGP